MTQQDQVAVLILGAGWTSEFLIPLLLSTKVPYTATSTTGRPGTQKFVFNPTSDDLTPYKTLPFATTIIITFPLTGPNQSSHLVNLYQQTHPTYTPHFIQLGSSGIFQSVENQDVWVTRKSRYDTGNARAIAEDELLKLGGTVLNLSGLWGGRRQARHFIPRVIRSKEELKSKTSLHMVHGIDVANAILAVHKQWEKAKGQRWLITDGFVYDWWSLVAGWGDGSLEVGSAGEENGEAKGEQLVWVRELMVEEGVRALPRGMETLGRCYDTRDFWETFGIVPAKARI